MDSDPEESSKPKNNTLSIRLTESAVFLTTDGYGRSTNRGRNTTEQRSTLLRGLLILQVVKPTRITSIEVELTATTSSSWHEGVGPRRIEFTENHHVFHASTVYFRASRSHARRSLSIGPGISYNNIDNDVDFVDWDPSSPRSPSNETPNHAANHASPSNERNTSVPRISNSRSPSRHQRSRRVSASPFRRMSLADLDESPTRHDIDRLPPIPPYSAFAIPATSNSSDTAHGVTPNLGPGVSIHPQVKNLEDPRHLPYARAISGHEDAIPEDDVVESSRDVNPRTNLPPLRLPSSPLLPSSPSSPVPLSAFTDSHSPISPFTSRGGRRFSFSSVSNVIFDAVRSTSPRPRASRFGQSREREQSRHREGSVDTTGVRRGRTMGRGREESVNVTEDTEQDLRHVKERGRGIIAMVLGEKERADSEGWREFKKGTYTFPISFSIPGNAPPTMVCDYGSVFWNLKANVHRPGTFQSKMTAAREVVIVACPTSEDTEDTENIIVERRWDQQMQYLICVAGRSFHIGGNVPVTFTLLPLAKVNVYRLSVILEERVDYYTNMRRIARTDPIVRFSLLSIKGDDNYSPILPLRSDDPNALRNSPLYALVDRDVDLSELTSSLTGPGPWTLHKNLKLPGSCSQMKFSNKNRQSNIIVTHTLKLVMRVERGDDLLIDAKTGKRKLFDIVVQTPVLILSCRCNPEWTCLPRYSEVLDDSTSFVSNCPCRTPLRAYPNHSSGTMDTIDSSDSGASVGETSSVNITSSPTMAMATLRQLRYNEAIMRSSSLFERLVSGQESVSGEVPPAYDGPDSRAKDVAVL